MSTAKYQPAPQQDPDYTSAPPAYGEASSSSRATEDQGLFGAPRSSEDNLPDDFKVSSLTNAFCTGECRWSILMLSLFSLEVP